MSKMYDDLKRAEQFRHGSRVTAGLHIKGEITGNEDLVVEGKVDGPIRLTDRTLSVERGGNVTGSVLAREVVVEGKVAGSLQTSDRLEIKSNGSVVGDVVTSRIIIDDGAFYQGSIEIDPQVRADSAK
jgi:cytoskeletal protein CcmA (bactofilin family)